MLKILLVLMLFPTLVFAQNITKVKSKADHPYRHHADDFAATNSPSDGQCYKYDAATGLGTWGVCGGGNVGIGSTMIDGTPGSVLFVGPGPTFAQDNANLFWDDTGNNLGIGSTAPGAKLDVQGTTRQTGFQLSTSPSSGYVLVSGTTGIGTWQPASSLPITVPVGANPTGTIGLSAVNGSASTFLRSDGAPPLSQTITPTWTGSHTFNNASAFQTILGSNVGLGTVAPVSGLTQFLIYGDAAAGGTNSMDLQANSNLGASSIFFRRDTGAREGFISWRNSGVAAPNEFRFWTLNAYPLSFGTGSSEKMRILSGGNVGIGTATPQGALTVMNGNVGIGTWIPSTALYVKGSTTPHGRLLLPMGEVSYFSTTGTLITIAAQSDGSTNMVVVNPTSTLNNDMEFDNGGSNNGRLRYTGTTTKTFHVAVTMSGTPANANDVFVFGVAKNGTVQAASKVLGSSSGTQFSSIHLMVSLATNDYLELYVGNTTAGRNFTAKSLNIFAMGT